MKRNPRVLTPEQLKHVAGSGIDGVLGVAVTNPAITVERIIPMAEGAGPGGTFGSYAIADNSGAINFIITGDSQM